MRHTAKMAAAAIIALTLGASSRPITTPGAAPARFMFPAVVVLHGGVLRDTIVFTHAGGRGMNMAGDTISMIYGSIVYHVPKSVEAVRRRPFVEVSEFFGPDFLGYWSGRAAPPLSLANNHSRIYLPRDGEPALWENPVVAPGGAQHGFYELGAAATRVLSYRGLKVR